MDEWNDEIDIDKSNPKLFADLREFCIKRDLRKTENKCVINKAGIANSVKMITPEPDPSKEALRFLIGT